MNRKSILVTGGAGFIGTHVLVALSSAGHHSVPLDNFSNSTETSVVRTKRLATLGHISDVIDCDIRDRDKLRRILRTVPIDGVIHLAGLKSVGESIFSPLDYYANNVGGTVTLLEELSNSSIRTLVFSSSASVYSPESRQPFREDSPLGPNSPYGRSKLIAEHILDDLAASMPTWKIAKLRYFNPVGAHPSGTIGEDPRGLPNNLMPFITRVAAGRADKLRIYGNNYPTQDGTGIRDFIHVMDLAEAHIAAINALDSEPDGTVITVNVGTGRGSSVLELVELFERVNDVLIPREVVDRRQGDAAIAYADCTYAKSILGWSAIRGTEDMCRDAWRWQANNPQGYGGNQS